MSAATTTPAPAGADERRGRPLGLSGARVLRSEWTKLTSLRSTRIALAIAVATLLAFAALGAWLTVRHWTAADEASRASFDAAQRTLVGVLLAQLVLGVLGVLAISGEYATGMIRASFAAVPRRLPVLWAKLAVYAALTFALALVTCAAAYALGNAILAGKQLDAGLGQAGVARAIVGAAAYLTVVGLLGLALGAITRSTAAGIAALVALLLVLPALVSLLPASPGQTIGKFLPSSAGLRVIALHHDPTALSAGAGFAVLCGYALVAIAVSAIMLTRRDV